MPFSWCVVHIQCQASIYTISLCRGHSWRVRLAKQETLTPPGHLVSPLVCRDPWMSTVVLYCWCHSDSASVLLYFTFLSHLFPLPCGAGSTGSTQVLLCLFSWWRNRNNEKKKEIWLSPMTNTPMPTENSKTKGHTNATKHFDYTTIADRLRTVSCSTCKKWSNWCG